MPQSTGEQAARCRVLGHGSSHLTPFQSVREVSMFSTLQQFKQLSDEVAQLHLQGRLQEALPLARQAAALGGELLGTDPPLTALGFYNLGSVLKAMGNLAAARLCFEDALAICEKALGPEHSNTARVL